MKGRTRVVSDFHDRVAGTRDLPILLLLLLSTASRLDYAQAFWKAFFGPLVLGANVSVCHALGLWFWIAKGVARESRFYKSRPQVGNAWPNWRVGLTLKHLVA